MTTACPDQLQHILNHTSPITAVSDKQRAYAEAQRRNAIAGSELNQAPADEVAAALQDTSDPAVAAILEWLAETDASEWIRRGERPLSALDAYLTAKGL